MDSRGHIHELPADARLAAGLIPIPDEELEQVKAMTIRARKGWYREHLKLHPAAQLETETVEEQRQRRNASKRTRKARKGK